MSTNYSLTLFQLSYQGMVKESTEVFSMGTEPGDKFGFSVYRTTSTVRSLNVQYAPDTVRYHSMNEQATY